MFCIRYSILSEYILKKHGEKTDNPSIRIYINKTENSIWSLAFNTEMMKLLGSTKSKITKDNVPHLEITVVILVYCNVVNNDYQQDWRYFA